MHQKEEIFSIWICGGEAALRWQARIRGKRWITRRSKNRASDVRFFCVGEWEEGDVKKKSTYPSPCFVASFHFFLLVLIPATSTRTLSLCFGEVFDLSTSIKDSTMMSQSYITREPPCQGLRYTSAASLFLITLILCYTTYCYPRFRRRPKFLPVRTDQNAPIYKLPTFGTHTAHRHIHSSAICCLFWDIEQIHLKLHRMPGFQTRETIPPVLFGRLATTTAKLSYLSCLCMRIRRQNVFVKLVYSNIAFGCSRFYFRTSSMDRHHFGENHSISVNDYRV